MSRTQTPTRAAAVFMLGLALATACWPVIGEAAGRTAYVRVNQVGYVAGEAKRALLMAGVPETGAVYSVRDGNGSTVYSAPVGGSIGRWSGRFRQVYTLDLSAITTPGTYSIAVTGPLPASSPPFRVAATGTELYGDLLANARFFYLVQRDGPAVDPSALGRQPSHLTDQQALVYETPTFRNGALRGTLTQIGGPVDVAGGWLDAGDFLKFVQTVSYTDAVMLFGVRTYPALLTGGAADFATEARFGLDWLLRMWDDGTQTLYYQVGIGNGNGASIRGDHDLWRLPEADDQLAAPPGDPDYYVKHRPVFRIGPPGSSISPNLAGRLSAAFALCFQVYRTTDPAFANQCLLAAEHVFDRARTTNVGPLVTAAPYDFYPEVEWRDDLELGAAELALATASGGLPAGLPHTDPLYYLEAAASWASAYIASPNHGTDSLNLYDVSALAHAELHRAILQAGNPAGLAVTPAALLADLQQQLDTGAAQTALDPFGLGFVYADGDAVPHALGLAVEAALWEERSGGTAYRVFGQRQLDWVLGMNAWGSSFVVGAGSTFPHCMQHQTANLSGSLDGTPPLVLGATVDGPSAPRNFHRLGFPTGARPCPPMKTNPFRTFSGRRTRYVDNVIAWPSVEPADDYAALTILAFAARAASH